MYRLISPLVFSLVVAIGLGATLSYNENLRLAEEARFKSYAQEAALRIVARTEQHVSLLQSTKALYTAFKEDVSPDAFRAFAAGLDLSGRYRGVQGIGFARVVPAGSEPEIEAELASTYGIERTVWPEASGALRTAIVLLEPSSERNRAALGFDMASEPRRLEAMEKAIESGEAVATSPVLLVQEITDEKQAGFLVYLPWYKSVELEVQADGDVTRTEGGGLGQAINAPQGADGLEVAGFIYAPFRAGDLHEAALKSSGILPVVLETSDVTGGEVLPLYRSAGYEAIAKRERMSAEVTAPVAGRQWKFTIYPAAQFADPATYYPVYGMGIAVVLLGFCAAAMSHAQFRAVMNARALVKADRRSLEEKDLMLQEMKHRLKNAIARISAMARQAAARSDNLEDFSQSFQGRLLAMANAQDMLTRSQWSKARLQELLTSELSQVLGDEIAAEATKGPDVEVNEKAAQALGLVFHELATNALKYGGVTGPDGDLSVSWSFEGKGANRLLKIDWHETRETGPVPESARQGFGSRLIQLNVTHELSGKMNREITETATRIVLTLPAKTVL
ncbi:CHASE domain-containing protein [Roseibium limicola]|uniref:histidine kinase n=1 Tax=Roseibium limicola TaxID=2816037 RepID=A0A939EQC3_9HYPH|nr:CHASE domain-containing protein [Roseibium limicola]MBO0345573.1 CHASE domain-containing protein [Roseibium limicola]